MFHDPEMFTSSRLLVKAASKDIQHSTCWHILYRIFRCYSRLGATERVAESLLSNGPVRMGPLCMCSADSRDQGGTQLAPEQIFGCLDLADKEGTYRSSHPLIESVSSGYHHHAVKYQLGMHNLDFNHLSNLEPCVEVHRLASEDKTLALRPGVSESCSRSWQRHVAPSRKQRDRDFHTHLGPSRNKPHRSP